MSLSVVQRFAAPEGIGVTSQTLTPFTNPVAAGNDIILLVQLYGHTGADIPDMAATNPVTDNAGGGAGSVFTRIAAAEVTSAGLVGVPDYGLRIAWFKASGVAGTSGYQITANYNENSFAFLTVWEVPPATVDNQTFNSGSANTAPVNADAGALTPSATGALALGAWSEDGRNGAWTWNTGWVHDQDGAAGNGMTASGTFTQASPASIDFNNQPGGAGTAWWIASGVVLVPRLSGASASGTAGGVGGASGTGQTGGNTSGSAAGVAAATGALATPAHMIGELMITGADAQGQPTVPANLTGELMLTAADLQGQPTATSQAAGSAGAAGSTSATVSAAQQATGSADATGGVSGSVVSSASLAGATPGTGGMTAFAGSGTAVTFGSANAASSCTGRFSVQAVATATLGAVADATTSRLYAGISVTYGGTFTGIAAVP